MPATPATSNPTETREMPTTPPTIPATMRALTQQRFGEADTLEVTEVAVPQPGAGEVLVAVSASAVDRGAWHLMTGKPYAVRLAGFGLRRPKAMNPGLVVAGTVAAVGEGVTRVAPGDEVFGFGSSAYAEYALVDEAKLTVRPAGVTPGQAATAANSGSTALQALHRVGQVQAGQRVLILGASGGVGSFAVQIAAAAGAHVTGVASGSKLDLVRALGADEVVDYRETDPVATGEQYDLIIDLGGNRRLRALRRALTPQGTLVIVGGENGGRWTGGAHRQLLAMLYSRFVSQRITPMMADESAAQMEQLTALMVSGAVTPAVGRSYPLDEVPEAMRALAAGEARGGVVIRIGE